MEVGEAVENSEAGLVQSQAMPLVRLDDTMALMEAGALHGNYFELDNLTELVESTKGLMCFEAGVGPLQPYAKVLRIRKPNLSLLTKQDRQQSFANGVQK